MGLKTIDEEAIHSHLSIILEAFALIAVLGLFGVVSLYVIGSIIALSGLVGAVVNLLATFYFVGVVLGGMRWAITRARQQ